MIAFGSVIGEREPYVEYAEPGIRAAAEPDSAVHAVAAAGTMARGCNVLLDIAAGHDDLEALVIVHPHCRIDDPSFAQKVRAALADPEVAVVGCAGGRGGDGLAWWDGEVVCGDGVRHRYADHGGGEIPAFGWAEPQPPPAEVDAIDGFLIVLSAWAVRELRFDESLTIGPGFDVDLCRQARAAGRKVVVADLGVVLNRGLELVSEPELWVLAHQQLAEKWDRYEGDWQARARRAEAEREAERAMGGFNVLVTTERLESLEGAMAALTSSRSWRVTAPLRWLNRQRRERTGD